MDKEEDKIPFIISNTIVLSITLFFVIFPERILGIELASHWFITALRIYITIGIGMYIYSLIKISEDT